MTNLLLFSENCKEHYFLHSTKGIYARKKCADGLWSQAECVIDNVAGPFWAYKENDTVHLIFIDSENNLCYGIRRNNTVKTCVLSALSQEICPERIQLYQVSGRLNLLYSASYGDEYILVHCILGNNAKPQKVNALSSPHFWICNNRVYYTQKDGCVGFTQLEDEKPEGFSKISDFGENVSVYDVGGSMYTLTTQDSRLYINSKEIIYDSRMELPAICTSKGKVYVMWKSGGYVRYITLNEDGTPASAPMRFMASGAEIKHYFAQFSDNTYLFYGYNTPLELHLFGKPDLM